MSYIVEINRDVTDKGTHNFIAKHYLPSNDAGIAQTMSEQRLKDNSKLMDSSVVFGIDAPLLKKKLEDEVNKAGVLFEDKGSLGLQCSVILTNIQVAESHRIVGDIVSNVERNKRVKVILKVKDKTAPSILIPCHWECKVD